MTKYAHVGRQLSRFGVWLFAYTGILFVLLLLAPDQLAHAFAGNVLCVLIFYINGLAAVSSLLFQRNNKTIIAGLAFVMTSVLAAGIFGFYFFERFDVVPESTNNAMIFLAVVTAIFFPSMFSPIACLVAVRSIGPGDGERVPDTDGQEDRHIGASEKPAGILTPRRVGLFMMFSGASLIAIPLIFFRNVPPADPFYELTQEMIGIMGSWYSLSIAAMMILSGLFLLFASGGKPTKN